MPRQPNPNAWNGYDEYWFTGEQGLLGGSVLVGVVYFSMWCEWTGFKMLLFVFWLSMSPARVAADVANRYYAADGTRLFGPINT